MGTGARELGRIRFALGALLGAVSLLLPASAATLAVLVRTADGRPVAGAVVTARSLEPGGAAAEPVHAAMSQSQLAFVPDVLIVPVGSSVDFPNNDSVNHQIYSFSPAKRFQLPLYSGKPYPPVVFDKPGLVTLGCNIHDAMLAYIVVTDAPFFGRTDRAGLWSAEVPRGKYRITVWHPRARDDLKSLEREAVVETTEGARIELRLTKPLKPAALEAHPHSWDAY